jgi:hypothetical protein
MEKKTQRNTTSKKLHQIKSYQPDKARGQPLVEFQSVLDVKLGFRSLEAKVSRLGMFEIHCEVGGNR